jgi:hypothetical protein
VFGLIKENVACEFQEHAKQLMEVGVLRWSDLHKSNDHEICLNTATSFKLEKLGLIPDC